MKMPCYRCETTTQVTTHGEGANGTICYCRCDKRNRPYDRSSWERQYAEAREQEERLKPRAEKVTSRYGTKR